MILGDHPFGVLAPIELRYMMLGAIIRLHLLLQPQPIELHE